MSLEIRDISLRDSLFPQHHHELFRANQVFLRVSPLSLISSNRVGKIIIRNASVYLFTDTTGYSNKYILQKKDTAESRSSGKKLPDIEIAGLNIQFLNPLKNKLYKGRVNRMDIKESGNTPQRILHIAADLAIDSLGFNTKKGYYLENAAIRTNMQLAYSDSTRRLAFSNLVMNINDHPYSFSGFFNLSKNNPDFQLHIKTRSGIYKNMSALLPERTRRSLKKYNLEKPVDLEVQIDGKTSPGFEPLVTARMSAKENNAVLPDFRLTRCSFEGRFTNQLDSLKEKDDANSALVFENVKATFSGLPLSGKKLIIKNFDNPYLITDLHSAFRLADFNKEFGSSTIDLNAGRAILNINFEGPIGGTDSTKSSIYGSIQLVDAGLTYIPRNIQVSRLNGDLLFRKKDLVVPGLSMVTGKSTIKMSGRAENFLSVFNISPEKLFLSWNVTSDKLFLEDFRSFLSKRSARTAAKREKSVFTKTSGKIDKMFTNGDVHITLKTPALSYRKFNASEVNAAILLTNDYVDLENVFMKHAGGSIGIKARMTQSGDLNKVHLQSQLTRINVPQIFEAFSDFGQDAITSRNLNGTLSATVNLDTYISDQAKIQRDLNQGRIRFLLENGELHNFEPVERISEKALKKQDFTHIRFADLENILEIKGTAFVVNKMEIRSTAITMFVEGIYDTKKGTDMSIQLPVRNLLHNQSDTDLSDEAKNHKGISVRLRAKTGDDGKLKVGWDPFKKAVKNKEAVAE